jgi:predicted alpha/beta-hydrolase family hydrolase
VACFDYPYREEGRRAPDRLDRLIACHRAVYEYVAATCDQPPFLVGKSMGGRVGSHLPVAASGWVFLGYPLVPVGKTEPRDVSHLAALGATLFVQGERDALAPIGLMTAVVAGLADADLVVVADADHGFHVPRRAGINAEGMFDHLATVIVPWLRRRGGAK